MISGIVNEADQRFTIGVVFVFGDIDQELLSDLLVFQIRSGHLDFEYNLLFLEHEVDAGGSPCNTLGPFFGPNVVEVDFENRPKQVLNVILIFQNERISTAVTLRELPGYDMELGENSEQAIYGVDFDRFIFSFKLPELQLSPRKGFTTLIAKGRRLRRVKKQVAAMFPTGNRLVAIFSSSVLKRQSKRFQTS